MAAAQSHPHLLITTADQQLMQAQVAAAVAAAGGQQVMEAQGEVQTANGMTHQGGDGMSQDAAQMGGEVETSAPVDGQLGGSGGGFGGGGGGGGGGGYMQDGGGFGSPMTDSQEKKRSTTRTQSILPCSIKQLHSATYNQTEDIFKLGSIELNQVSVIGVIRDAQESATNIMYTIMT
ncbi:DNA-directed RNA polymerase I subunit rpa2 [Desmophyllum pertusum]|uniref:DNA-directed RNA polymerase I subunit rpa2 n=1 Tax=Desmophyllum pertusum TaxID=174260 RepID=A0A9X0CEG8_9CNID|nr:DNA-directed RNA polymerase I subunit rpa2 [Desmophyllum pertusum]